MIARELINLLIPSLDIDDDITKASSLMDDLDVHQLPVVEKGRFKGFVADEMLFDEVFGSSSLASYQFASSKCTIYSDQHFYEVAKVASECDNNMVAVLDRDDIFLGVVLAEDLFKVFSQTIAVQSPGSVVVISVRQIDYSLSEITRLVEAENTKITGCYLTSEKDDPTKLEVTLKFDKKNVSHIVATLERFNYNVIGLYQEESIVSYEKERLDALMKYLNI